MSADDFFNRWARKNQDAREQREQEQAAAPPPPDPFEGRTPSLEDVQSLTPEADFSPFMKQGVDETVKRSALKKLFADPHFNIMDGLDVYIDDYTKADPIPPEMMAMLQHAPDLLNPPGLKGNAVLSMLDPDPVPLPEPADGATPLAANDARPGDEAAPRQLAGEAGPAGERDGEGEGQGGQQAAAEQPAPAGKDQAPTATDSEAAGDDNDNETPPKGEPSP